MAAYPPTHIPIPKNHADFESKSVILLRLLLEDPGVKKLGRSGQKQYGIDLIGYRKASLNRPVGIQCKKKKPGEALTAKEVRAEVRKALKYMGLDLINFVTFDGTLAMSVDSFVNALKAALSKQ